MKIQTKRDFVFLSPMCTRVALTNIVSKKSLFAYICRFQTTQTLQKTIIIKKCCTKSVGGAKIFYFDDWAPCNFFSQEPSLQIFQLCKKQHGILSWVIFRSSTHRKPALTHVSWILILRQYLGLHLLLYVILFYMYAWYTIITYIGSALGITMS